MCASFRRVDGLSCLIHHVRVGSSQRPRRIVRLPRAKSKSQQSGLNTTPDRALHTHVLRKADISAHSGYRRGDIRVFFRINCE
jgi:hypothetical protein